MTAFWQSKFGKLLIVCVLCVGIIAALVLLVQWLV